MNKDFPLVSIVIPFYNNIEWLTQALESVIQQTYTNTEVIIVNDGSKENTSLVEIEFDSFLFFKTENRGAGAARNFGIEIANGDYICFLDSDDLWHPRKIEKQLNYMLEKKLVWSHTNYSTFEEEDPTKILHINTLQSGYILPKMLISCPIATPCMMIKTEVLKSDSTLRFNDKFKVGEDSFFWINLAEKYFLGHLSESLTKVRLRGSNAAFDIKRQLEAKALLFQTIKNNRKWFKKDMHFFLVKQGFNLANSLYVFLNFTLPESKMSKGLVNNVYKLFYAVPYLYLKALLKILKL